MFALVRSATRAVRQITLALFCLVIALPAAADTVPPQEPVLRNEAGMHTAQIQAISVSADGRFAVTGSDDKTARLWSLADGALVRVFRLPVSPNWGGRIFSVALSPDGRTLAVGGFDAHFSLTGTGHFAYVFDVATGKLRQRLGPLPTAIAKLAFSSDGSRLAAGLWGTGGIAVWQYPFTAPPFRDQAYGNNTAGVDFARDGSLATASWDGFLRLYDRNLVLLVKQPAPTRDWPQSVAYSPDGQYLAIGYFSAKAVDYVSPQTLQFINKADASSYANFGIPAISWSADGSTLYAAGQYYSQQTGGAATRIFPVIAWSYRGTSLFDPPDGPHDSIMGLTALPQGGLVYASLEPRWGQYDSNGRSVLSHGPVTAEMREKQGSNFWASADGHQVWFGLGAGLDRPHLLDVTRLTFSPAPQRPAGFISAVTNTLPIENWYEFISPLLNKTMLQPLVGQVSRSLSIAPDNQSFVIGTDTTISRLTAQGQLLWQIWPEAPAFGVNLTDHGDLLVAALGDGTIRWYRASDGRELLAFFAHAPDRRWIAWTPKGYYAASPGGEDLNGWLVNGADWDSTPDFFPLSRFRAQFYRPDIVQKVLETRDEAVAIAEADKEAERTDTGGSTGNGHDAGPIKNFLPPIAEFTDEMVQLETDRTDIMLHYRVRSPSGRAVTRVEVLIDGRPVTSRAAVPVDETEGSTVLSLTIPRRDSEITIVPYVGEQAGLKATMPVRWRGRLEALTKPRLFALLIGISDYENSGLKLNYAAKDAADLANMLQHQQGSYYDHVEIKVLLDRDATEDAIETELARLRRKAAPEDNVIVFMAGHGYTDSSQDFYFLPTTADLSPDRLAATAIDGDIIRKNLSRIPGKVILFMDACHAGAGIEGGMSMVDMSGVANGLSDEAGVVMFASSAGREVSYESSEWGNGAFTAALLQILADPGAYGDDGKLSISELDEELTTRVERLTGGKQTPVMTKPGAIKRFFLASRQ